MDQPLDWLFRRGSDRSAARAGVDRAVADSSLTVAALLRDVRAAFYRARASRLAEALIGAQATLADSVARIAGARLRAGDTSLLEQEQAAQDAARARQAAAAARATARIDETELARAIAWDGTPPTPAGPLDTGVDQLRDSAIDVARLPTLQSGAEWGDDSQPGALAVICVAVPFPLWNLGGATAAEANARAARAAALARQRSRGRRGSMPCGRLGPAPADPDDDRLHACRLVPLSLGLGAGAELQRPLALAVIGGLVVSTLVTLLIVPVLIDIFGELARRRSLSS